MRVPSSLRVRVPARTIEELQDALDASLSWRRVELSSLRNEVERSARRGAHSPLARALSRSGVALLYAHWEGFAKDAFGAYVDFLSRRRLKVSQLNDGLLRTVFAGLQRRAARGDAAAASAMLEAIRRPDSVSAPMPRSGVVNTKSNLRYDVLVELLDAVGLDAAEFATRSNLIDRLLCDARNEVAHGREHYPAPERFNELHAAVMTMMEALRHRILEAVRLETYKMVGPAQGTGEK